MKKLFKAIAYLFVFIVLAGVGVILVADLHISVSSKNKLYNSIDELYPGRVGLVPGTSKFTVRGTRNLFYQYRLDAAVELYNSGLINYVIVSGDNRDRFYDEPTTMKNDLIELGIPGDVIYRDFAGNRTLDSVIRSRDVFRADSILVISQRFQNQRAVFLANHFGVNAIGYNARNVSQRGGIKTQLRERFARVAALKDVYIARAPALNTEPAIPVGEQPGN